MADYRLDIADGPVVVAYDTALLETRFSAAESFIEQERSYSRVALELSEAILHRGPTPYFWENVDALERLIEGRNMRRFLAGDPAVVWSGPWKGVFREVVYSSFVTYLRGDLLHEVIQDRDHTEITDSESEPDILTFMYSEGIERASSIGISMMFDTFFELQAVGARDKIDAILAIARVEDLTPEFLAIARVEDLTPEFMVGLLRVNFPERPFLSEWDRYLSKVETELVARKMPDIPAVLQGLRNS